MNLEVATSLMIPVQIKRPVGRPKKGTTKPVIKRIYTCRAMYYGFKCQLQGKHKGVHLHGFAQPGSVVTVTWHAMVSNNIVPKKGKTTPKTKLERLALEMNPELIHMA